MTLIFDFPNEIYIYLSSETNTKEKVVFRRCCKQTCAMQGKCGQKECDQTENDGGEAVLGPVFGIHDNL